MESNAKEVYDAVMQEVRNELSRTVVGYEKEMIKRLEKKVDKIVSDKMMIYDKRITDLEKRMSYDSGHSRTITEKSPVRNKNKIDMNRDDIRYDGFEFNGWIYYPNKEMGGFLYKVRKDGSDNQQLTEYSVVGTLFSVRDGKIFFYDTHYKEHSVYL